MEMFSNAAGFHIKGRNEFNNVGRDQIKQSISARVVHIGPTMQAVKRTIYDELENIDNDTDSTHEDYLYTALAPSYGTLTPSNIRDIDEKLKIMISDTMKMLDEYRNDVDEMDWDCIMGFFMRNSELEPIGPKVRSVDKFIKKDRNFFKVDGSPDQAVVEEVKSWFTKLISDEDVFRSTLVDIEPVARIVAQTGATITSVETAFYKKERHDKTLVGIGVLRFPDFDDPHFKAGISSLIIPGLF
ncbi:hypothetical protein WG66_004279 [Moniliophthora roreri]|nr:hypothetical protein WG66_004279 [Moniliophthora roreri]